MEPLARNAFRAAEPAFLQSPQGWTFFLEACEIAPGRWRSGVRIHTQDARLVVRVRCKDDRGTEAEALQDAKDCAESNFRKIEERRRHEVSAWDATDLSCDERRKAEMLLMAFLWLDHEMRAPVVRTMGTAPVDGHADAAGDARIHQPSHGLREKSRALIDELRMPRDRQTVPATAPRDARLGEICRTGKKGNAAH